NPMAGPVSWSFTTKNNPPSVRKHSPSSNATNVSINTTATATFSESVQASTIHFTLTDPGGATVPATVAYDNTTFKATLTPSSPLPYWTKYRPTVSGAKDQTGLVMKPVSWSFATAAKPATPGTIRGGASKPANPPASDPGAVEAGVKFRGDVAGS